MDPRSTLRELFNDYHDLEKDYYDLLKSKLLSSGVLIQPKEGNSLLSKLSLKSLNPLDEILGLRMNFKEFIPLFPDETIIISQNITEYEVQLRNVVDLDLIKIDLTAPVKIKLKQESSRRPSTEKLNMIDCSRRFAGILAKDPFRTQINYYYARPSKALADAIIDRLTLWGFNYSIKDLSLPDVEKNIKNLPPNDFGIKDLIELRAFTYNMEILDIPSSRLHEYNLDRISEYRTYLIDLSNQLKTNQPLIFK